MLGPWMDDFEHVESSEELRVMKEDTSLLWMKWKKWNRSERRHLIKTAVRMWGGKHGLLGDIDAGTNRTQSKRRGENTKKYQQLKVTSSDMALMREIQMCLHTKLPHHIGALILETANRANDLRWVVFFCFCFFFLFFIFSIIF